MDSQRESRFKVDGMDCASCALKIDTAVRDMPGIVEVSTSVMAQVLTVLHTDTTNLHALQRKVGRLGLQLQSTRSKFREGPSSATTFPKHNGYLPPYDRHHL